MLLKIIATNNRIAAPDKTGLKTYQYPIEMILADPIFAIKAVAPPGGCSVFVICIETMETETAKAEDNQGSLGIILCTVTPTIAQIICPPSKFLGWAKGLLIIP